MSQVFTSFCEVNTRSKKETLNTDTLHTMTGNIAKTDYRYASHLDTTVEIRDPRPEASSS